MVWAATCQTFPSTAAGPVVLGEDFVGEGTFCEKGSTPDGKAIGVLIPSKDELQFAFWSEHVGAPAGCPRGLLQGAAVGVVCALSGVCVRALELGC